MKLLKYHLLAALLLWGGISSANEDDVTTDSTGLPGDHFSLQGALDLFKSSASLEDFEKKLNSESNAVNNLDLNEDGEIDYIRVVDNTKDNAHAIVLQVPVSETESQDVAVIELEKNGNESATVQIVGDEELYGDSAIVEPFGEKEMDDKKGKGPSVSESMHFGVIVNVWFWPCVKFVYAPAYVVWVSPWHWHHYPGWWAPWQPHPWRWHYEHCWHYHSFYHPVFVCRVGVAHAFYTPFRKTSVMVVNRNKVIHANYKAARIAHKQNKNFNGEKQGNKNKSFGPKGGMNKQGGKGGGGHHGPKGGGKGKR